MIKITWDQSFKRSYNKKIKNNKEIKEKFWHSLELFSKDIFNSKLRTHKLTGRLQGLWAFSCSYDCRVIFKFINRNEVLLIDTGSHEEVY